MPLHRTISTDVTLSYRTTLVSLVLQTMMSSKGAEAKLRLEFTNFLPFLKLDTDKNQEKEESL